MKRWAAIAVVGILVASATVLGGATPASAATCRVYGVAPFCLDGIKSSSNPAVPTPHMPGTGLTGELDPTPAPGTSRYAVYGYGPLHWSLYAQPSVVTHPGDLGTVTASSADQMVGGWLFGAAVFIVALGNGLGRVIDPPVFLGKLDNLVKSLTDALDAGVWKPYLKVALIVVALGIMIGRRREDLSGATNSAMWAVGVLALVGYVVLFSTTIGSSADRVVSTTIDGIYASVGGQSTATPAAAGSMEINEVIYPQWLDGLLGSSTSATAVKYAPMLYQASGYSWAETGGNGSKSPTAATTKKLSDEWTSAATAIKKSDPAAYDHLTDADTGRVGAGAVALIAAILTMSFRLIADFLVLAALLLLRVAVVLLPAVGVIGINDRMAGLLRDLIGKVGSALISCVVFSAGAAVNVRFDGAALSSFTGLPVEVGLVVCGAFAVLLWVVLKPYRRMTAMVGAGMSGVAGRRYHRRSYEHGESRVAAAAAAAVGGMIAGTAGVMAAEHVVEHHERDEARAADPPDEIPVQPAEEATPAEVDDNPLAPNRPEAEPAPAEPEREAAVA